MNAQRKPVVLVGMSIGGILATEVAQRCPQVKRTVATCLVDCSDPQGEGSFRYCKSLVQFQHSPTSQVVLAHPENDLWTLLHLSTKQAYDQLVLLPNCGHLPNQEPGVNLLVELISLDALL